MASIHRLLDTFGPPPREICLDWAYQIQAAATSAEAADAALLSSSAGSKAAHEASADAPDWTALEVAEDGTLQLDRLTASMARQALAELGGWLSGHASGEAPLSSAALQTQTREIEPAADMFRASASLDLGRSDREACQPLANRKRVSREKASWLEDRRRRLTVAALLAAAATLVTGVWIAEDFSAPLNIAEQASSTAGSHNAQQAGSSSLAESPAIADTDLSPAHDDEALEGNFTTSEELTGQALQAFDVTVAATAPISAPAAPDLSLRPSLAAKPIESDVGPSANEPAEPVAAADAPSASAVASQAESAAAGTVDTQQNAQQDASIAIGDVMSQVASAVAQAESQSSDSPAPEAVDETDAAHQPALMLTRDANPLRIRVARDLTKRSRNLRWTARLELPEEFICEPLGAQPVEAAAAAQWRIYDKEAKSPRACIVVSVRQRSGRDLDLEWSLRGSSEDFPLLQLPVAPKWLDGLSAQLKMTAAALRGAIDAPSPKVPKEMRALVQNQRKLARQQLAVAERLLTLLADIHRLASLLDDELLGHAELRATDSDEIAVAYGSCITPAPSAPSAVKTADRD